MAWPGPLSTQSNQWGHVLIGSNTMGTGSGQYNTCIGANAGYSFGASHKNQENIDAVLYQSGVPSGIVNGLSAWMNDKGEIIGRVSLSCSSFSPATMDPGCSLSMIHNGKFMALNTIRMSYTLDASKKLISIQGEFSIKISMPLHKDMIGNQQIMDGVAYFESKRIDSLDSDGDNTLATELNSVKYVEWLREIGLEYLCERVEENGSALDLAINHSDRGLSPTIRVAPACGNHCS